MFAVGHIALGYILGKITADLTKTRVNLPLIFGISILPDIDLLIPWISHRGPTHSIITVLILFTPLIFSSGRKTLPYTIAYAQHSLIGDYITGNGVQLFWPINHVWYGGENLFGNQTSILLELVCFVASILILLAEGDLWKLLKPHTSNLTLIVPLGAIISPLLLTFPLKVPIVLWIPHFIYMLILTASILLDLKRLIIEDEILSSKQRIE